MVFKKGNPGCPCCPCPCYYFEGSGKDSFGNKRLTESGAMYSKTFNFGYASQGSQSAQFTGSSYFQREKDSCFSPYGHTTWTISFDMKIVYEPELPQSQAMGLITRGSWDGNPPAGTMSGEWAIIYEHQETGNTVYFILKTDSTTNALHGLSLNDSSGTGASGFNTISWTIGTGTASKVVANGTEYTNNYVGSLVYGDDDLYIGNNTDGLKLGEASGEFPDIVDGGEILIDNLCFSVT